MVYLDFGKAFNAVPHKRLLRKLCSYGISGKLLLWIEAFLTGRKKKVVINGSFSDLVSVKSGVPQGFVLGPLLFLLYVNDIPSTVDCTAKMFADDSEIYQNVAGQQCCGGQGGRDGCCSLWGWQRPPSPVQACPASSSAKHAFFSVAWGQPAPVTSFHSTRLAGP